MDYEEFAASRNTRLEAADKEMRPIVAKALANFGGDWAGDIVELASVLWLEIFQQESPDAFPDNGLRDFAKMLTSSLEKTSTPDTPPSDGQIDRITMWLGTVTVNDATVSAHRANSVPNKRWVTMRDGDVRDTHVMAARQTVRIGAKFKVGGYELDYPGQPIGPPEIWINCRCVVQGVGRGRTMNNTSTTFAVDVPVEEPVVEETVAPEDAPVDEELPIPFHGVAAPVGVPSGDGRMFAIGSIEFREFPFPLLYQRASDDGHGGSVRVGAIDKMWVDEANLIQYSGTFNSTPEVEEVISGLIDGSVRGVSVDVDQSAIDMQASTPMDDIDAFMSGEAITVFSRARIAGLTVVAIPAFQEAYLALGECDCPDEMADHSEIDDPFPNEEEGDGIHVAPALALVETHAADVPLEEQTLENLIAFLAAKGIEGVVASAVVDAFAPGTKDGPGWITNPEDTARIRRYWTHGKGAAKIRWGEPGDFNRCRKQLAKYITNPQWLAGACANMHKEALGVWPGRETGAHSLVASAPSVRLVYPAAETTLPSEWFANPKLSKATALTVTKEGRVFGHIAKWGVCHIGLSGVCTTAPFSATNYAMFRTGAVLTEKGEIAVGQITMTTGHAGEQWNAKKAIAHYDNTGTVVADVTSGEDAHGIWVAGALRDGLTEQQVREFRAAPISGDWRRIGGSLELVAALAVNVPGFPVPRTSLAASGNVQTSLIAAGIVEREELVASVKLDMDSAVGLVAAVADEMEHRAKRKERLAAIASDRDKMRTLRIERAKAKVK
jgi:hypothetical protein